LYLKIGGLKMTIVKININKVNAQRNLEAKGGQFNLKNNVALKNVEEMEFNVPGKKGIKFSFAFNCNYQPDLGSIEVEGQVLYVDEEAKAQEVLDAWKNKGQVPSEVMVKIVNAALHKGNIQAIKISEDINLPSPLQLPKVKAPEAAAKKE